MPSIKLAKYTGFCAGVRRAINIVEEILDKEKKKVYSLGSVIHNSQVIEKLKSQGLEVVNNLDQVDNNSVLILPSHGSPRNIRQLAKEKKLKLVDVMCPYVASVHSICKNIVSKKWDIVIVGDKEHPEIRALKDLAPNAFIIKDSEKDLVLNEFNFKKLGIISQTTQDKAKFFEIVSSILDKNPKVAEVHIFNTICLDTTNRQEEVKELAKIVDALLVIGSKTSANTNRLYNIGRKINKKTYLVDSENVTLEKMLKNVAKVGIISGASAPDWLVKKIEQKIKNI